MARTRRSLVGSWTFLGVFLVASSAAAQTSGTASPIRYQLANGLSVVLDPLPERETVAVVVAVNAGQRDQPEGWSGLAHLTEHLLFSGTPAAPGQVINRLERLGASELNGETTDDATTYYETVPRGALERVLWLEAERFGHGLDGLDEATVDLQRRVVDRERELRDWDREEVWDLVNGVLYPAGHPYSHTAEITDDVHAIHLPEVQYFFQRYYAPDHLTLALSGGFDTAQARAWIERYFGPMRRVGTEVPPAVEIPPPVTFEGERRVLAEARRSNDLLHVLWSTPAWGAAGDADLDFVARELQHRLDQRLRRAGALSVQVVQGSRPLASAFQVTVAVPRGHGTLESLQALDEELAALRAAPMAAEVVERWRGSWLEGVSMGLEGSSGRARRLALRLPAFPQGAFDPATDVERYRAVTRESIHATVNQWLPAGRRLVVSIASRREAPYEGQIVSDGIYVDGELQ